KVPTRGELKTGQASPPAAMLDLCKCQSCRGEGGRSVKSPREHMEIVNAYALVGTFRGAAALCGTTHKTVKRVVSRREVFAQCQPREVVRNTAVVEALIADRVRASDGRISAKRLLPIVEAAGYAGSARNLRRAVAIAKVTWKRQRRTYRPWVPVPCEHL